MTQHTDEPEQYGSDTSYRNLSNLTHRSLSNPTHQNLANLTNRAATMPARYLTYHVETTHHRQTIARRHPTDEPPRNFTISN